MQSVERASVEPRDRDLIAMPHPSGGMGIFEYAGSVVGFGDVTMPKPPPFTGYLIPVECRDARVDRLIGHRFEAVPEVMAALLGGDASFGSRYDKVMDWRAAAEAAADLTLVNGGDA